MNSCVGREKKRRNPRLGHIHVHSFERLPISVRQGRRSNGASARRAAGEGERLLLLFFAVMLVFMLMLMLVFLLLLFMFVVVMVMVFTVLGGAGLLGETRQRGSRQRQHG